MKKSKTPDTILYLPRDIFNALITALDYFIALESRIGETVYSKHATRLKNKILTHSRAYNNGEDENASIYFYGIESAMIMKLLSYYVFINKKPTTDYFAKLKKRKNGNSEKVIVEEMQTVQSEQSQEKGSGTPRFDGVKKLSQSQVVELFTFMS